MLGVKAVIAESFERIHRSNLIGMGVLALEFLNGHNWKNLKISGDETFDITGIPNMKPREQLHLIINRADGATQTVPLLCRIDTDEEMSYFKNDGILSYVLKNLAGHK